MSVGMVIMRPTSIVVAGGGTETASIRAAGGVEFANATSLSLNGVFTSDYDDYMIVCRFVGSVNSDAFLGRLRSSGTDATGTDYTRQYLISYSTTNIAARETSQTSFRFGGTASSNRSGSTVYIYGPNLAQPTAARNVALSGVDGAQMFNDAGTHSLSTAYDGVTIFPASGNITGLVTVYGLAQ